MKLLNIKKRNSGQIVLIVLLASAVLLTLGLSASKKATVDTKVDTDQELLKQAFNTAESGVDYYLTTGQINYSSAGTGSSAVVTAKNIGGGNSLSSDGKVLENDTFLFWLAAHDDNTGNILTTGGYPSTNTVNICASDLNGSLKVDYFYKDGSGYYKVYRGVYTFGSKKVNGTETGIVASGSCVSSFSLSAGTPLLIAVTPIGGSTNVVLNGNGVGNFPSQGKEITSVGTAAGVNSQVKVVNRYKVPDFMLNTVTASDSVLNN